MKTMELRGIPQITIGFLGRCSATKKVPTVCNLLADTEVSNIFGLFLL